MPASGRENANVAPPPGVSSSQSSPSIRSTNPFAIARPSPGPRVGLALVEPDERQEHLRYAHAASRPAPWSTTRTANRAALRPDLDLTGRRRHALPLGRHCPAGSTARAAGHRIGSARRGRVPENDDSIVISGHRTRRRIHLAVSPPPRDRLSPAGPAARPPRCATCRGGSRRASRADPFRDRPRRSTASRSASDRATSGSRRSVTEALIAASGLRRSCETAASMLRRAVSVRLRISASVAARSSRSRSSTSAS